MEIQKFNPTVAEIKAAVLEVDGLTISGVDDEAGYAAVKVGKKRLADYRIEITKFGKKQREEALAWQKEVLRQEKELLKMIEPTETNLKSKLEAIDEEKRRKEREHLLPARIKMLEKIEIKLLDAEILRMDEKEFSTYYTEKKMAYLEEKDRVAKEKEVEDKRAEELEKARKEAAENARKEAEEKAEWDKQDAIDKIKQEQADKEKAEWEAQEKIKFEAEQKRQREKAEQEKAEKNRKYKKWLKDKEVDPANPNVKIERIGNTFVLWLKADEITIN